MTTEKRGRGRPPHQPSDKDRGQVEAMASYGIPELDIARVLKIDAMTLRKHYRDELDTGHIKANSMVAQSLFKKACGEGQGSVVAAIFWLKCRARWRDVNFYDHELPPGKKQQAQLDAQTATVGTDWADDIAFEGDRLN